MWTERGGGKQRHAGIDADADAIFRGGSCEFNPATGLIDWKPWADDTLTLEPVLPAAASGLITPLPAGVGWIQDLSNGWQWGVADTSYLKGKWAGILDDYALTGPQIFFVVPIGDIPTSGEFRIEKLRDTGEAHLTMAPTDQGVLSAQDIADGSSRDKWVDYSLAWYHGAKRNVVAGDASRRYMTGKVGHMPPPLAFPLKSNLPAGGGAVETVGQWDIAQWVSDGWIEKAFDGATLHANKGNGTHYIFAATIGYTSVGASGGTQNFNREHGHGPYTAADNYLVETIHQYYTTKTAGADPTITWVLDDDSGAPKNPVANSVSDEDDNGYSGAWATYTISGDLPSLSLGADYWIAAGAAGAMTIKYDATAGKSRYYGTVIYANMPQTPTGATTQQANFECSIYMTVKLGGCGGGGGGGRNRSLLGAVGRLL